MKVQSISKSIVRCFMICVAASLFFSTPNQVDAQATYTVTGFANGGFGAGPGYTAVFEIDTSVVDSDDDPERGLYTGAIISSSIVFDNGLVSSADFAGGDIHIRANFGGGGIFIDAPGDIVNDPDTGTFILYEVEPLTDDTLLTRPEVMDLSGSLWSLRDQNGSSSGFSDPDAGVVNGTLAVSAAPVLRGDANFDGEVTFLDIQPFIEFLSGSGYRAEADMNQDGEVNFLDIAGFIRALST